MLGKYDHPVDDRLDGASIAMYRRMTGAECLRVALGMQEFAVRVIESRVRHQFPEWTEPEVRREIAHRMLDAHD